MIAAGLAAILALLMAGMRLRTGPAPDYAYYDRPQFRIIAHRGGMGLGPENTIETFERGLAAGADVLDMDIRMTRDGELVIMHDATVDRTTDGSGAVRDMDLRDIKKLNAGFHWLPEGEGPGFSNRKILIPTVAEVFQAFPNTLLVMEIKDDNPATVDILCELLATYQKTDSVLVASMHSSVLSRFREICPEVATSAGPGTVMKFYVLNKFGLTSLSAWDVAALQVPLSDGKRRIVTPDFVSAAHRRNIKVEVWTINDVENMQQLIEAGVDGIFTDFPDRLKTVKEGRKGVKKRVPPF